MLTLERNKCVICYSELTDNVILHEHNMPITFSPTIDPREKDIHFNLNWIECIICGCVQLKYLIEPSILYDHPHNQTQLTYTWNLHHTAFMNFIGDVSGKSVLEVGGSDGYLRNKIMSSCSPTEYYICDFSSDEYYTLSFNIEDLSTLDVIPSDVSVIIMSHTLEHLYYPRVSIENLYKLGINTIFISVPWMEMLLEDKSISILHIEHTFYIYASHLKFILESSGFNVTSMCTFNKHSIFIKAERNASKHDISSVKHEETLELRNYFKLRTNMLHSHKISKQTILAPGGHFASIFYNYLSKEERMNIVCCIDNDPQKQNKRLYGTDCMMLSLGKAYELYIENKEEELDIIIISCPYQEEIKKQIIETLGNSKTVHIVTLTF